jgi:hypothetical protein
MPNMVVPAVPEKERQTQDHLEEVQFTEVGEAVKEVVRTP